jgi:hypothetical protein
LVKCGTCDLKVRYSLNFSLLVTLAVVGTFLAVASRKIEIMKPVQIKTV